MGMARYFGYRPDDAMRKMIEQFENQMLVRYHNRHLVCTVYVDLQEKEWAVAFAYNYSHVPGIHGHENPLEVKYHTSPHVADGIRMFRSDEENERALVHDSCEDPSAFIRFVLECERTLASGSA